MRSYAVGFSCTKDDAMCGGNARGDPFYIVNLTQSRSHGELQQMKVLAANHPDFKVSVKCFFSKHF